MKSLLSKQTSEPVFSFRRRKANGETEEITIGNPVAKVLRLLILVAAVVILAWFKPDVLRSILGALAKVRSGGL